MFNRRESLKVIAGAVGAWTLGATWPDHAAIPPSSPAALTPEQEEGPFYIDAERMRSDIREDRTGVPLQLEIALVDAGHGGPLAGAAVDIWHCDAAGIYSGFKAMGPPPGGMHPPGNFAGGPPPGDFKNGPPPGPPPGFHGHGGPPHHAPVNAKRFLRGVQLTDQQGVARFTTIYPGWYAGREIHIHLKVHTGGLVSTAHPSAGHVCHTGQIFFPDSSNETISRLQPYVTSKTPRTTKATDGVYRGQNGAAAIAAMRPLGTSPEAGYAAAITLAVDATATPKPVGFR